MFAKQWTFFQGDLPHYTFKQGKQGKRIPGLNYSFILMVCVQRNVQCYLNFVFCLMFTSFFFTSELCRKNTTHNITPFSPFPLSTFLFGFKTYYKYIIFLMYINCKPALRQVDSGLKTCTFRTPAFNNLATGNKTPYLAS